MGIWGKKEGKGQETSLTAFTLPRKEALSPSRRKLTFQGSYCLPNLAQKEGTVLHIF